MFRARAELLCGRGFVHGAALLGLSLANHAATRAAGVRACARVPVPARPPAQTQIETSAQQCPST